MEAEVGGSGTASNLAFGQCSSCSAQPRAVAGNKDTGDGKAALPIALYQRCTPAIVARPRTEAQREFCIRQEAMIQADSICLEVARRTASKRRYLHAGGPRIAEHPHHRCSMKHRHASAEQPSAVAHPLCH
ncbi:hypothetical protein Rmf_16610 [Roseomonas fluvialis]|uniref:Uncharacterized protein n=1 Tax=Roseomonas fluvialis TaxID=1750527 RepID=A0ABM7Y1R2_9PROT|nr:hypothetical protein Rmf_16610 [Roseomonas fluvialis]